MMIFSIFAVFLLVESGGIKGGITHCHTSENEARSEEQSLPFRGKRSLEPSVEESVALQLKLEAIAYQSNVYSLPKSERTERLKDLLNQSTVKRILEECRPLHSRRVCDGNVRYRSMDGTCNNLKHPEWGSAYSRNLRMLPPLYEGAFELRKSVTGSDLPSPRSLTLGLLGDEDRPAERLSLLFPLFGQLLDHDVTDTPLFSQNGSKPACCPATNVQKQLCAPVLFSACDPFYSSTCLQFVRSAPYPACDFRQRVPMNAVTSFIDASVVYGTSEEQARKLRTLDGSGKLISQTSSYGQLLKALGDGTGDDACPPNATRYCFSAGDSRVNEHAFLTSLQTLFMREHNRLAHILRGLNPHWDGETLYQEARRIVGAEFQVIVCKDFLPYLLDSDHQLCDASYDEEIDPGIMTEFSTAAYRLHSMITHHIRRGGKGAFMATFSNPFPIHRGRMEHLVKEASVIPAQKNDPSLIPDIKNFLYKYPHESFGIDLPTINIQRGRDHGLPVYVQVAEKCSEGLLKIKTFSDLSPFIPLERISSLQNYYKDVRDIDLWIGLVMEKTAPGRVVGPTSLCVLSSQFKRLISGDRFFYKNKGHPNSFDAEQIRSLETSSLARVFCDNFHVSEIARNPLLVPSENNPVESCQDFSPMDFKPWKSNKE